MSIYQETFCREMFLQHGFQTSAFMALFSMVLVFLFMWTAEHIYIFKIILVLKQIEFGWVYCV